MSWFLYSALSRETSRSLVYLSAMSWSWSGGTGTPSTLLSLWILWKTCWWLSRLFNTSCAEYTEQRYENRHKNVFIHSVFILIACLILTLYCAMYGSALTLCCSRALCTVLAVISCACWMVISCRRASSASCSHAPTVSRGAGRDLSSWRCQSSN